MTSTNSSLNAIPTARLAQSGDHATGSIFTLTLSCPNRPGIVAAVSTTLFEAGANIRGAQQFDDIESNRFFMRTVFDIESAPEKLERLTIAVTATGERFGMSWSLNDRATLRRVMILVSKFDHCLADLLYRHRIGELRMAISAIVCNHPRETLAGLDFGDIPFHCLPVTRTTRMEQEAELWSLIQSTKTDLVVLARYMQVLSDGLSSKLLGRCINIHHSFLPGFKGAKPYHQAHIRGVKLIGATAHYVTGDLDDGPIIDQDVERISHADSPEALIIKGRDIERRVLARAVQDHLEDRILLNGNKTVIFND